MCRGQCKKSSLEHKLQFPTWLSMTKDRAKSFNKIRFSKNGVSSYVDKEGDIGFLQWRTDINMSKFAVVSKKYFTKFRPGQKPSETKGIAAHDDVTCPICWNNCQKCVILGKSSKHVRFIFVSFLSQKTDLSLEGGATAEQLQSVTGGYPGRKWPFQITLHCWPPELPKQSANVLGSAVDD